MYDLMKWSVGYYKGLLRRVREIDCVTYRQDSPGQSMLRLVPPPSSAPPRPHECPSATQQAQEADDE